MLYKICVELERVVHVVSAFCIMCCIFCVVFFSKEKNKLITGKWNLEEQCKSAHKNILKFTASQYALFLYNGSLNNELTLTIQYLDVTQETTSQLTYDKKELNKKLQ